MIENYLIIAVSMCIIILFIRVAALFIRSRELIALLSSVDIIARFCLVLSLVYYIAFKLDMFL